MLNILKNFLLKCRNVFLVKPSIAANRTTDNEQLFKLISHELTDKCLHSSERGVTDEKLCDHEVIVSLTTYSKRLYEVYLAIESIMQGSMLPNRIVLWLQDDYKDKPLPITLQKQMKRGLEVRYCKDIKSYKKLIPALQEFPDAAIITIDDDVIYNMDIVEKLVNAYKADPHAIYANRVRRIELDKESKLLPYNDWKLEEGVTEPSLLNFFTGVGGVLYPPHCFHKDILNEELFMGFCPHGDDIWFYVMGLLNGYYVSKVYTHSPDGNDYLYNDSVQDIALYNSNKEANGNDLQIKTVFSHYNLYNLLKE